MKTEINDVGGSELSEFVQRLHRNLKEQECYIPVRDMLEAVRQTLWNIGDDRGVYDDGEDVWVSD